MYVDNVMLNVNLSLNGVRRKEPILAIIYDGGGGGVFAHVIECLSRRSGG